MQALQLQVGQVSEPVVAGEPGVGAGGIGGPASGIGIRPGVGAGAAGVGIRPGVGVGMQASVEQGRREHIMPARTRSTRNKQPFALAQPRIPITVQPLLLTMRMRGNLRTLFQRRSIRNRVIADLPARLGWRQRRSRMTTAAMW